MDTYSLNWDVCSYCVPGGFKGRGSQSRQVTIGNLSEVVTFELRLDWTSKHEQIWGNRVPDRGNNRGGWNCAGMGLAISKKRGNPGRSFPGINSHNG